MIELRSLVFCDTLSTVYIHCVRNIRIKNYQNLLIGFQVTVKNVGDVFLRHSVVLNGEVRLNVSIQAAQKSSFIKMIEPCPTLRQEKYCTIGALESREFAILC